MLVLFYFLPALSPKPFEVDTFRSTYLYIMVLVVGLFAYMQGVLLYTVLPERRRSGLRSTSAARSSRGCFSSSA